jgi:hypothetical protein
MAELNGKLGMNKRGVEVVFSYSSSLSGLTDEEVSDDRE